MDGLEPSQQQRGTPARRVGARPAARPPGTHGMRAVLVAAGATATTGWADAGVASPLLVPIANRPILVHAVERLADCGVRAADLAVDAEVRDEAMRSLAAAGPRIAVRSIDPACENALPGPDPILVLHADALIRPPLDRMLRRLSDQGLDALVLRVPRPIAATREARGEQRCGLVAGCLLAPEAAAALRACDTLDLRELLTALVRGGAQLGTQSVEGHLACHGDRRCLLDANRLVLEELHSDLAGAELIASEVQGPVAIDASAVLRSTLVRGPAVIGAGARLVDAYVGPFTAIGDDVVLEGAEIEHSLVLDGAEIRFPGMRVESSFIGPRARLVRDFRLPRGVRLTLGAGTEVAFS